MAELVDALDSKSSSARSAGSIPARGTTLRPFGLRVAQPQSPLGKTDRLGEATSRSDVGPGNRRAGQRLPGDCGRPRSARGWTRPADRRREYLDVYSERAMAPRRVQACSPRHSGRPGWQSPKQPLRDVNRFAAWTSSRCGGALRGRLITASGRTGNHPPAEPGALSCEPLKAAVPGSLTRPRLGGAA